MIIAEDFSQSLGKLNGTAQRAWDGRAESPWVEAIMVELFPTKPS